MGTSGCLVYIPEQGKPCVLLSQRIHQIAWHEFMFTACMLAPQVKALLICHWPAPGPAARPPFVPSKVVSPCSALVCVLHLCAFV